MYAAGLCRTSSASRPTATTTKKHAPPGGSKGELIGIDIKTGWFWPLHWNKWNRQIQLLSNIIILTFTIKLEGLLLFSRRRAPGTSQQLQPHRPPPGTSPIEGRSSCDDHEEFGPRERFVQRYALHRGVHCAKLSTSQDQRSDFA